MITHIARAEQMDIVFDRGRLVLGGHFRWDGCCCQGIGYTIDAEFIVGVMQAFGVSEFKKISGRSCIIVRDEDYLAGNIVGIRPLHSDEGKPFDIKDWAERRRGAE